MIKGNIKTKKTLIAGTIFLVVIVLLVLWVKSASAADRKKIPEKQYNYNIIEQQLADEVKAYLGQHLELSAEESGNVADVAVQNYNTVMESETDIITAEITEAVHSRIKSALMVLTNSEREFTDELLDVLSAGITEIIWSTVLEQISGNELSESAQYQKEYERLSQSLQKQIDELKERKMKISVNARVVDNTDVSSEDIFTGISELSDEELMLLAEKLGLSLEEILGLTETAIDEANEEISEEFNKQLEDEIYELKKELRKDIVSMSGTSGSKGEKGNQGEAGKDGKDGKDGVNGKTTYIAYADDTEGTNFSITPTETSKYVGTCITEEEEQPLDYSSYANWQEYRSYVITETTDPETGITTVHIN